MLELYNETQKHGQPFFHKHYCLFNNHNISAVDPARFLGHKNAFVTANTYAHSPQTHKAAIADSVSKRMQRMAA